MHELSARRIARLRLAGLRRRVGAVRRGTLLFAISIFAAAWAGVFVQMVSGHDPVLGSGRHQRPASSAHASANTTTTTTPAQPATKVVVVPVQTEEGVVYVRERVPVTSGAASAGSSPPQNTPSPAPSPPPVSTRTS